MSQVLGLLSDSNSTEIANALREVAVELREVIQSFPKPFVFLRSEPAGVSSAQSENVLIIAGTPVPRGFKGQIEDFNVNFSTVAGTVKLAILNASGNRISDILLDINSNTSGIGKTILDEGQTLAVLGQTSGAGVFSVYCSGVIIKSN